jgi:single-stranded-DNA-specific exonuclease
LRWVLPEPDEEKSARLAAELGLHPLAARVLVARGFTQAPAVQAFLADRLADLPDPALMKGMAEAVPALVRAIRGNAKITLYGDYDVDGVCSTALLALFLRQLGAQVATYIPHRIGEGYGLNLEAIERLAADGTRLLVTLDCGITSVAEVARARALGLQVVIVDHHTVPQTLPPALAILNPHQVGCDYPTKHLCAAGVAFNLCLGVRRQLREEGFFAAHPEPNLRESMDLVALATIADVVPLTGANRVLVKAGLAELSAARRPGIWALKEVSGLEPEAAIGAGQVGFRLAPRINAAGRMDDASVGLRLLCAPSLEEARPLAKVLDQANAERQSVEQEILTAAFAQAETRSAARGLVLHSDAWHPGVIGIVASRVVERFHRPTVLIAMKDGEGRGSARSIEGFHMVDALGACAEHLTRYGGHKQAAGLSISGERLEAFRTAFEAHAAACLGEEDLTPRCRVDAVLSPGELDEPAVAAVQALGPFGNGNPEPTFATRRQVVMPRVLANKRQGAPGHLKLRLEAAPRLDAIGFSLADRLPLTEGPVDLAFHVGVDEYRGVRKIALRIKDLRASP